MSDFQVSPEHSPMSGLDEYLVHNHPNPLRVMWTSDDRAYERIWFSSHDDRGDLMAVCGLGFYPNLGTAEAYAIVNREGRHTTVRAHRLLGDNRMDMRIGPIGFEVVEPFREWRLTLDRNDFGISYDIRWMDTTRAIYRNLGAGSVVGGRPFAGVAGYDGFGVQEGWMDIDGERIQLDPSRWSGSRDHHWGTRDGVGGRSRWSGSQHAVSGAFVRFPDWSVWVDHLLRDLGDPKPGSSRVLRRTHRLRFEPVTRLVSGGEIDLELPRGPTRTVIFERLGHQIAFLRCGMYGGPNGGTPDGDIWQGDYVGDGVVSGETYDVVDPAVRSRICGLDQHHARFECDGSIAYGIFEAYDTLCHEVAATGRLGLSVLS
ncbi:MAG: hypothetical protein ACYDAD_01440 [Acidimicrobiales bacterium]